MEPGRTYLSNRRYLVSLLSFGLLCTFGVVGFNWLMNPFDLFSPPAIEGLNDCKPALFSHLRMAKAYAVTRAKPEAIILGSSRAETGLSPSHPGWLAQSVYNLGLSDCTLMEMAAYFEHACYAAPVKQALVMLDFGTYKEVSRPGFDQRRLGKVGPPNTPPDPWKDWYDGLMTYDALKSSIDGLLGRSGEKAYLRDGSRDNEVEWRRVCQKGGLHAAFAAFEKRVVSGSQSGKADWTALRKIISLADSKNVELFLVIAPVHQRIWRTYAEGMPVELLVSWRRELVEVVSDECARMGKAPIPVWDFGASPLTAIEPETIEKESGGELPLYFEASHFSKRLGDLILNRILLGQAGADQNFGVPLTVTNLDSYLSGFRQNYAENAPPGLRSN